MTCPLRNNLTISLFSTECVFPLYNGLSTGNQWWRWVSRQVSKPNCLFARATSRHYRGTMSEQMQYPIGPRSILPYKSIQTSSFCSRYIYLTMRQRYYNNVKSPNKYEKNAYYATFLSMIQQKYSHQTVRFCVMSSRCYTSSILEVRENNGC